jgi:hypothetical protein
MIRVGLPRGYRLASYRRPRDEGIVVLAGAIEVDTRTLTAGSFTRLRADEWHSLSTHVGAILQICGFAQNRPRKSFSPLRSKIFFPRICIATFHIT